MKLLKAEDNFQKHLSATPSTITQQGPKQTGKLLCCVPDWLSFWLSASLPSAPPKVTSLFSHWLWNSSHSWVATAREVCTSGGRSQGTMSRGRHSYPMHFWYPAFSCPAWHLPTLPGCREWPRVCSTFLLPAQRSVGVSRRKQGVQSQLTINTQHCCCLTHISEQQRPRHDFYRRSAKVKTLEQPPSTFRVKHWGWGWEGFIFSAQVSEKMFSKIYQLFAKIVAFLQSMEAAMAPAPTEL